MALLSSTAVLTRSQGHFATAFNLSSAMRRIRLVFPVRLSQDATSRSGVNSANRNCSQYSDIFAPITHLTAQHSA